MRFGINTFLFSCPFTDASTRLLPKFKKWGFDSVEISVEDFAHLDPERLKAQLNEHGLVCGSVTPCLGADKDLRGTLRQQRAGVEFMKRVVDLNGAIECPSLIGVVYSAVGRTEAVPPVEKRKQWKTVVRNLRELCALCRGSWPRHRAGAYQSFRDRFHQHLRARFADDP
jgi:D-psicose/D-tagatose/L-ribulose 3-epimerase